MSVLDLLAELQGVGKPDGDPALVRQAAHHLAGLAEGLERAAGDLDRGVAEALAGWEGPARERFSAKARGFTGPLGHAATVLGAAAAAANRYATRLEAAQARWQQVRGGAVVGRALRLPELLDPDIRRAVTEAEAAATDARAAAVQLAAELGRLAAHAPPLPAGAGAPQHQDARLGAWLFDWADRFAHDPLGAVAEAHQEFYAGMGETLRGYGEFAWLLARATSPAYELLDGQGAAQARRELAGIVTEVGRLTTIYLMIDPKAAVEAHRRLWLGLIGWDTLRTANLPRWGGQLAPDAILAAAGGEVASVARARAAASAAATVTQAGALAAKPRIAAHIEDAAQQTGGTPVGRRWWVKSHASLARKILEDMRARALPADEAAREVTDALRFTITYPGESLAGNVEHALDRLRGQGYEVLEVQNSWVDGNRYKGVNVDLKAPGGQVFELQFHTPDSWLLKQETHGLYEVVRDRGYPLEVRLRAHEELVRLSAGLEHPAGIERIGTLKVYRRPGE
jgi:uncharacterized protein YukE